MARFQGLGHRNPKAQTIVTREAIQMLTPAAPPARKWKPGPSLISPLRALESLATCARFARGEAIYRNGEPADYWYRIVAGASRKCAFPPDGSRQIVDF